MSRASIETFHRIEQEGVLSKRRLETLKALWLGEKNSEVGLTHNEIALVAKNFSVFPPNYRHNVVARLCELEEQGVVRRVLDTYKCPVSGETCTTWETVDATPKGFTRKTLPTKVELIEALCQQIELLLPRFKIVTPGGQAWVDKTNMILAQCARHRKKKSKAEGH